MMRYTISRSLTRVDSGFTIVEMVVVFSIVGVLLSLLIPAIQAARESARQVSCRSNLHQIGVAVHSYHDTYGMCPPCCIWGGFDAGTEGFSWQSRLLPYLDQGALYSKLQIDRTFSPFTSYFNATGRPVPYGETLVPVFRCPSSAIPSTSIQMGSRDMDHVFAGYGTSDYKGSGGQSNFFGMFPVVTCGNTSVRFRDVTDGLSQCLMLGESSNPGREGRNIPIWIAQYGDAGRNTVFDSLYAINCVESFGGQYWTSAISNDCALSLHVGMCHFTFGDGAVRPLSENMDRSVYAFLGSISDGRAVGDSY